MKLNNILLLPLLVLLTMSGCQEKSTIEGLWLVKSVTVGEDEMTPNARWMRFNDDGTQQSGNGLFQHSFGTWEMSSNKLKVNNTNGLADRYEAFNVGFKDNKMTWERTEEGQTVVVNLERTKDLPLTYGDQILGLWKLNEAIGSGSFFSETNNSNDYLFFRWDKRFVIGTDSGRYSGVYQVNGHRPQVALFTYDKEIERSNWEITYSQDGITLKQLNVDSAVTRSFQRIHAFPE